MHITRSNTKLIRYRYQRSKQPPKFSHTMTITTNTIEKTQLSRISHADVKMDATTCQHWRSRFRSSALRLFRKLQPLALIASMVDFNSMRIHWVAVKKFSVFNWALYNWIESFTHNTLDITVDMGCNYNNFSSWYVIHLCARLCVCVYE